MTEDEIRQLIEDEVARKVSEYLGENLAYLVCEAINEKRRAQGKAEMGL